MKVKKIKLNIGSVHLVLKPSSDVLPTDPDSNDRKGWPCLDRSNRHDRKFVLNEVKCKELNTRKYGEPTNPFAVTKILLWISCKL